MIIESLRLTLEGDACNAKCPFCITKVMAQKPYKMNWDKFDTACKYARNGGAQNVIITSQGEPTLYPLKIIEMLDKLKPYGFSIVELQTNGNLLASESYNDYLSSWHNKGLNKILLSVLSIDSEINSRIMGMPYYNIEDNVKKLHDFGYSIRLSCMMFKDGIDSAESLEEVIGFAKKNKVEQLAVRHVTKHFNAKNSNNELSWVNAHELSQEKKDEIRRYIEENGTRLMELSGGGMVYDFHGQNMSLIEAFPLKPEEQKVFELSLWSGGIINYNKRYRGAIIL